MSHAAKNAVFYSTFGLVNLAIGVTFYMVYFFHIESPAVAMSFVPVQVAVHPKNIAALSGIPVRIVVPSIGIDVNVGVGSFNPSDATWTLDNERAFFADTSVPVNNNNGATLIYGHARDSVFGRLGEIPTTSSATVYTDTGYAFYYTYQSRQDIDPTNTSIFRDDGAPTLVLQTCSGPWDVYRTMVSFQYTGQQKV